MATKTEFVKMKVKTGDLLSKEYNEDASDVYECVIANDELFVLGRAKFKAVSGENGEIDYEVCGCSWENLKAYENNAETLEKQKLEIIYSE